jgi:hypothetical protein
MRKMALSHIYRGYRIRAGRHMCTAGWSGRPKPDLQLGRTSTKIVSGSRYGFGSRRKLSMGPSR